MKHATIWLGLLGLAAMACPCAATGATAESAAFRLSLKADGVRESSGNEMLAYSPLWAGSGERTAILRQDGAILAVDLVEEGSWNWSVERNGVYILSHEIVEGGEVVGEETATFVVAGWDVPFPEGDVGVASWEGMYDGAGHGVAVSVAERLERVEVRYATAEDGPWSDEAPLFTDACAAQTVWCAFSAPGYLAETNAATVTVLPREVSLASATAEKPYDGNPLTAHDVTVGGDGFAEGEGADYGWTGTQTDAGTSENTFTYTLREGTKAENYAISTSFGTLTVGKGTQTIDFPSIGAQVATNVVTLGANASSGLAVSYAVEGPTVLDGTTLSFTGVGTVTVTATQAGDDNWNAAEPVSVSFEVTGMLTLTVECSHGTAMPTAGTHDVLIGTVVEATAGGSPAAISDGLQAICTGWRLSMGGTEETGEGMEANFTMTDSAVLTWLWETQALIQVEGLAHGTAEGGGWYALGETATLTATPEAGHPFTGWEGDFGAFQANPLDLTVTKPGTALATFYTTYYASEDGDDSADGLSWATAKREIAAALAETAEGDTVLAGPGVYGVIAVPADVAVRSTEGPEETTILGDAGARCVEAADGATVEGFTLAGAEVEGDGAGALLADGATLFRCILRGNKATGSGLGGGAKGGALENCLLVGNEAASGGGAANAELRHCTVVQNRGGGVADCRTVNSVFWENEDGDVSGGTTTYSLCNPWTAGTGNLEGDPCFAGEDDWRLAYESPCINAACESALREDLDGDPRPQPKVYGEALKPDMGCWEYVPKARFVWAQGNATPPYETWAEAANDIQSALDISSGGDLVVVESGTYGAVTMSNAVVLMGYRGAEETVIDGANAARPVTMLQGGTLEGFTVRNGSSDGCGGIFANDGAVVRDVVVENCRADIGGGLCLQGGSTAENVVARGNSASYGGGIMADGTSTVVRCEMAGNTATWDGGGAFLEGESRMEGSVVQSNTAVRGAGVYAEESEIAWCELEGNTASGEGGGARVVGGTFRNNRLAGNRAGTGGGLFAQDADGHDCLVTGNEGGRGAGVWAEGDGELWNFTVADNGGTGAGVALRGTTLLGNTIVWNNAGGALDAGNGTEVRYSCANPAPEGEGNFAADPAFVGEGDYHLRAGSPCVDAGERQVWMAGAEDFDGQPRVQDGDGSDGRDAWVDIGTDEAALDAIGYPKSGEPWWTWRVVLGAQLQLQHATDLLDASTWENVDAPFTATDQIWTQEETFESGPIRFYRLLWIK